MVHFLARLTPTVIPDQDDSLILKCLSSPHFPHVGTMLKCKAPYSARLLPESCIRVVKWTVTETGCCIFEAPVLNRVTLGKSLAQSGLWLPGERAGLESN